MTCNTKGCFSPCCCCNSVFVSLSEFLAKSDEYVYRMGDGLLDAMTNGEHSKSQEPEQVSTYGDVSNDPVWLCSQMSFIAQLKSEYQVKKSRCVPRPAGGGASKYTRGQEWHGGEKVNKSGAECQICLVLRDKQLLYIRFCTPVQIEMDIMFIMGNISKC